MKEKKKGNKLIEQLAEARRLLIIEKKYREEIGSDFGMKDGVRQADKQYDDIVKWLDATPLPLAEAEN